jgi:hypothetical protein
MLFALTHAACPLAHIAVKIRSIRPLPHWRIGISTPLEKASSRAIIMIPTGPANTVLAYFNCRTSAWTFLSIAFGHRRSTSSTRPCLLRSSKFFPKLPAELQMMVWEFAVPEPRTIAIKVVRRTDPPSRKGVAMPVNWVRKGIGDIPNILHACRDSRAVCTLCSQGYVLYLI